MYAFINWCNNNSGFLTAIFSGISIFLSTVAIVVSINTARIPYKKKILLGWSYLLCLIPSMKQSWSVGGCSISLVNIGNRPITINFIGFAIKEGRKFNLVHGLPKNRDYDATLSPSNVISINIGGKDILETFCDLSRESKLYLYVKDTEGKTYKKQIGTLGKLLNCFSD